MDRVVGLHTVGIEIPELADVAVGSVREEDELRLVVRARRIGETAVPVKQTEEQFRRGAGVGGGSSTRILRPGELVAPPKIQETVHIALVVVLLRVAGSIEWDLELCLRQVALEIDYVIETRRELNLSKSVPVLAVIVEVLDFVRRWIQDHRLPTHVGSLV